MPSSTAEPSPAADALTLSVPPEAAGLRLDRAIALLLPDRSRTFIRRLFDSGLVEVAASSVASDASAAFALARPALPVRGGETVRLILPPAEPLSAAAEDIPLDILYEDNHIVVINKPAGIVVHPSAGHPDGTLVNALLHHYGPSLSAIGGVLRPGIVHRLDRDTSGCLVAAKTDAAHAGLMRQFMERTVEKMYLAITDGSPRPATGRVEGAIGRSRSRRGLQAMLTTGGRYSLTHYRTLESYPSLALVECRLATGRTHQARVHMAHLGCPVLCDREYGRQTVFTPAAAAVALAALFGRSAPPPAASVPEPPILSRSALHAAGLSFRHPADGREMAFEAPFPADMLAVLAPLRAARAGMK